MRQTDSLTDDTLLLRCGSLLYSIFWFAEPLHRKSFVFWGVFLAFFAIFLTGYLRVLRAGRTEQLVWLAVLFILGYAYYPFNPNAGGEFVFAVVMSGFLIREADTGRAFRIFAAVMVLQAAGLLLETRLLHLPWAIAQSVLFFMVVLGLSNFAYARQVLSSRQLRRANEEIQRLTQFAERERIARDLHDLLGHTLTVIAVKSDLANRLFESHPILAHQEIVQVEATARDALREVREAVSGYRSKGFLAEVASGQRALSNTGVAFTADLPPTAIPNAAGDLLSFIFREAVTNVLRHAEATQCRLRLEQDAGLRMTVEDNGGKRIGPEGNGIRGMRERIERAGGTLRLEPGNMGGLRVTVELPLPNGKSTA